MDPGAPLCSKGQFKCLGTTLEACGEGGYWFVPVEDCGLAGCDAEHGRCNKCFPGLAMCEGSKSIAQCSQDGQVLSSSPCPAAKPFCADVIGQGPACVECASHDDCPESGNVCRPNLCIGYQCTAKNLPKDWFLTEQVGHDCRRRGCDGAGNIVEDGDPLDKPLDDNNPCTDEVCAFDTPHPPTIVGTPCGQGGICNGQGACGVCMPGETSCASNTPTVCATDGSGYQNSGGSCSGDEGICALGKCGHATILALGARHGCVVVSTGGARCWGAADDGQLGNGAIGPSDGLLPVTAAAVYKPDQLSLGARHSCLLSLSFGVGCWGANGKGQLGNGTTDASLTLTSIDALGSFVQSLGLGPTAEHACAVMKDGTLQCWGDNEHGQIGVGSPGVGAAVTTPQVVQGMSGVVGVVLGQRHTCAATNAGSVWCWGANDEGQLGLGAAGPDIATPTAVPGLTDVADLTAGAAHTCARRGDGSLLCWGRNAEGQLGIGAAGAPVGAPTLIPGLSAYKFAAGGGFSCALAFDGTVSCWGDNAKGQLGNGSTMPGASPAPVSLSGVADDILAGGSHACALVNGQATCWGDNGQKQLGVSSPAQSSLPTAVMW